MEKDSLESIELEMAILIRRITNFTSKYKEANIDRSAYLLLHQLSVEKTAGVKVLAVKLQLDISTVSRQASALEQKGFIDKVINPTDRRAYFYQLNESGEKQLEEYKQVRLEKFSTLLEDWTDKERKEFGSLLKKFNYTVSKKL